MGSAAGLLLAAGSGSRMGRPKALVRGPDGQPWVRLAAGALHAGGCEQVTVVVGAAAEEVTALLDGLSWADAVSAPGWATGMSASLAAGLAALAGTDTDCAVVALVDTPDVGPDVVARVLAEVGTSRAALGRAAYEGRPGHPVVLGRDHWPAVLEATGGDRGARDYLAEHPGTLVECADLATGADIDTVT